MKKRTPLILIVLVALLLGSLALTWTALAREMTATGSNYHLAALDWQVRGSSSAGEYHLQSYFEPLPTGHGCCCIFLPCIFK